MKKGFDLKAYLKQKPKEKRLPKEQENLYFCFFVIIIGFVCSCKN